MNAEQINRVSSVALWVLSLTALLDVLLLGYMRPPLPDEGTGAHIFQLSIVALLPIGARCSWPRRTGPGPRESCGAWPFRRVVVVLAFAALYYLEHYFYPAHYR